MSPVLSITEARQGGGQPAVREGGVWVLQEARRWLVRVSGGPWRVRLDARELAWDVALGGVVLDLPFAVGRLELELERGPLAGVAEEAAADVPSRRWRVPLEIRPDAAKLDTATWEALLADLETWLPSLTVGADGPRAGSVSTAGVAAPLLVEAVLPLLPALESALRQLIERPHLRATDHLEETPLHRTRAADRETVAWLVRHPREAAWLDPVRSLELSGPPPSLPRRTTEDTLDHPANRHVAWLVERLVRRLGETAEQLDSHAGSTLNQTSIWTSARATALRSWARRLDALRRRSFLRRLRPRPASEGAMLVVLDHPLYSRVHRLARRVLAARFRLQDGPQAAAVRPSFELYELWTFLAVQRALAQTMPELSWTVRGLAGLLSLDGTGGGARFRGSSGDTTVELLFNPTFPSILRGPMQHGRVSLSTERRPDLVLAWKTPGDTGWVVFDAKYRVGARNLGEAMASVHIYRDALRWPERGGACRGAWLLAPRETEDCGLWFSEGFRREHGMGIVEVRPGGAVAVELPGSIEGWGTLAPAVPA